MSFDLTKWLREQVGDNDLECPPLDMSGAKPEDEREWLVTNGMGSFASGGILGANTRRYHGLLIASLDAPVRRTVMFTRMDEVVEVGGERVELATNHWAGGHVAPQGYKHLKAFTNRPTPTWVYAITGGVIVKQVMMQPKKQQVVVGYTWIPDGESKDSVKLTLHMLANYRDFHSPTRGANEWRFEQHISGNGVNVKAFDSARGLRISFDEGSYKGDGSWYWNYQWPREWERGLDDREDNYHLGALEVELTAGKTFTVCGSLLAPLGDELPTAEHVSATNALKAVVGHQKELLRLAGNPKSAFLRNLVLACDQFVVDRKSTQAHSIIAGYHWFGDWGRDSMISMPGLTLTTGRADVARGILKTFGRYVSQGMLPNYFPDSGQEPEYNTLDATLWWAWSLYKYHQATGDLKFVKEQLPLLDSVVDWHRKGTRHHIKLDESDGLVAGGEPGVQLTWMDAKCGDFVVTPRQGKAVEINALWYNLLKTLEFFHRALAPVGAGAARSLHQSAEADGVGATTLSAVVDNAAADTYARLAEKTRQGFAQFWNSERGCFYDVIRDDGSKDSSIRPNQLFALSLPFQCVTAEQAKSALEVVEKELLTPKGMRTLEPKDPEYKGIYGCGHASANQYLRDITYHQGTVWPWLLGAWVDARIKVHGSDESNKSFVREKLNGLEAHMTQEGCVGSISEIFDGDAPHRDRGCIAQAWSVAELTRVLAEHQI